MMAAVTAVLAALLIAAFFAVLGLSSAQPFAAAGLASPIGIGIGFPLGETADRVLRDLIRRGAVLLAAMTNYLEDNIVKHLFRTGSFTKPTVLAVALYTAAPGEAGGGTEVTGGSYARVELDPLDANWAATSGGNGTTSNSSALTFPAPTANWGTVVSTAILDATSAGNMLLYGSLTTSKTINNGDAAPSFAINALSVAFD